MLLFLFAMVVELTGPIEAVRPLGRRAEVRVVRFFADDPRPVLEAFGVEAGRAGRPQQIAVPEPGSS